MPARYRGHALTGDWRGYRESHVHDLVIYGRPDGLVKSIRKDLFVRGFVEVRQCPRALF